eukprot:355975-Prymnesium_polylepis.2
MRKRYCSIVPERPYDVDHGDGAESVRWDRAKKVRECPSVAQGGARASGANDGHVRGACYLRGGL